MTWKKYLKELYLTIGLIKLITNRIKAIAHNPCFAFVVGLWCALLG